MRQRQEVLSWCDLILCDLEASRCPPQAVDVACDDGINILEEGGVAFLSCR